MSKFSAFLLAVLLFLGGIHAHKYQEDLRNLARDTVALFKDIQDPPIEKAKVKAKKCECEQGKGCDCEKK